MILVIFGASMLLGIAMLIIYDKTNAGEWCSVSGGIGFLFSIIAFIAIIILGIHVKSISVIDYRIEMYEEENIRIEQQIADVVKEYQKYETDIFMEVAPESAVTMVSLYPELKSDSLVQAQVDVYVENNKTIKYLKDKQIKGDVYRWWLYFGGKK